MNGIMASTWLRDIHVGSDQDILVAELKEQSFLLKSSISGYLTVHRIHVNTSACVREHLLATGEHSFCRSSTLPDLILPQIM